MELPTLAISIKQPWAGLIVQGIKDIENRTWATHFRGWVLIHASKRREQDEWECVRELIRQRGIVVNGSSEPVGYGGIVGMVRIVDCVTQSASPWFVGDHGFVMADARPLPFFPCKGALGFWKCDYPQELLNQPDSGSLPLRS